VLGGERLLIANDNNYPGSDGRWTARDRPDDTELIVCESRRSAETLSERRCGAGRLPEHEGQSSLAAPAHLRISTVVTTVRSHGLYTGLGSK
jgi:hypothetical protein